MQRVNLTPDLTFSRLVYGMWRIGDDPDTSSTHVQAKIEACLAQGITTMDQADIYGGYKGELMKGLGFDVGLIGYLYPSNNATTNANKVARIDLDVFLSAPHT